MSVEITVVAFCDGDHCKTRLPLEAESDLEAVAEAVEEYGWSEEGGVLLCPKCAKENRE
jgi:hypothetical protein